MKKTKVGLSTTLSAVLTLFLLTIFLVSCDKDDPVNETPVAGLQAFNLIPEAGAIGIALDGNIFTTTPLTYTSYTGEYRGVYAGNRTIESYDYQSGVTLDAIDVSIQDSGFYSLFVTGTDGAYTNVFVEDNLDSVPSGTGNAFFRYVNAIPDSTNANIVVMANGTEISNNLEPFGTVSSFAEVAPGDVTFSVNNTETGVDTSRTISLEQDKVYTVLLSGLSNATDTSAAVQIKYIVNGTITP